MTSRRLVPLLLAVLVLLAGCSAAPGGDGTGTQTEGGTDSDAPTAATSSPPPTAIGDCETLEAYAPATLGAYERSRMAATLTVGDPEPESAASYRYEASATDNFTLIVGRWQNGTAAANAADTPIGYGAADGTIAVIALAGNESRSALTDVPCVGELTTSKLDSVVEGAGAEESSVRIDSLNLSLGPGDRRLVGNFTGDLQETDYLVRIQAQGQSFETIIDETDISDDSAEFEIPLSSTISERTTATVTVNTLDTRSLNYSTSVTLTPSVPNLKITNVSFVTAPEEYDSGYVISTLRVTVRNTGTASAEIGRVTVETPDGQGSAFAGSETVVAAGQSTVVAIENRYAFPTLSEGTTDARVIVDGIREGRASTNTTVTTGQS